MKPEFRKTAGLNVAVSVPSPAKLKRMRRKKSRRGGWASTVTTLSSASSWSSRSSFKIDEEEDAELRIIDFGEEAKKGDDEIGGLLSKLTNATDCHSSGWSRELLGLSEFDSDSSDSGSSSSSLF